MYIPRYQMCLRAGAVKVLGLSGQEHGGKCQTHHSWQRQNFTIINSTFLISASI